MAMPVLNSAVRRSDLRREAHIWHLYSQHAPLPVRRRERWLSWLAPHERRTYEEFRMRHLRETFLSARALCRAALSHYTGVHPSHWRFTFTPNGKPIISEPIECAALRFNVTHTDDLIVCIVTACGDVGVDAEKMTSGVDDRLVARHFLSKSRQRELEALPAKERIERFFEQWVLKEAYVKARGCGLAAAPERLTVYQNSQGTPSSIGRYRFTLWKPTRHHVAAAALAPHDTSGSSSFRWLNLRADTSLTPELRHPCG